MCHRGNLCDCNPLPGRLVLSGWVSHAYCLPYRHLSRRRGWHYGWRLRGMRGGDQVPAPWHGAARSGLPGGLLLSGRLSHRYCLRVPSWVPMPFGLSRPQPVLAGNLPALRARKRVPRLPGGPLLSSFGLSGRSALPTRLLLSCGHCRGRDSSAWLLRLSSGLRIGAPRADCPVPVSALHLGKVLRQPGLRHVHFCLRCRLLLRQESSQLSRRARGEEVLRRPVLRSRHSGPFRVPAWHARRTHCRPCSGRGWAPALVGCVLFLPDRALLPRLRPREHGFDRQLLVRLPCGLRLLERSEASRGSRQQHDLSLPTGILLRIPLRPQYGCSFPLLLAPAGGRQLVPTWNLPSAIWLEHVQSLPRRLRMRGLWNHRTSPLRQRLLLCSDSLGCRLDDRRACHQYLGSAHRFCPSVVQ